MPVNPYVIDDALAVYVNNLITYKRHILNGRCEFAKSCWFCNYYDLGDVKRTAIRHMHGLLDGYFETTDGSIFILREKNNLVFVEYQDKTPTLYASIGDEVKSLTHNILNWAVLYWTLSLDTWPEKNLSEFAGENVRKQISDMKEKAS